MAKKKENLPTVADKRAVATRDTEALPDSLFSDCCVIIEKRKYNAGAYANKEIILMCHEIGQRTNFDVLGGQHAEYGKRIVAELAQLLREKYGSTFDYTNVRRMAHFAARFPDFQIVAELAQQLSCRYIFSSAFPHYPYAL
ncbi:MAG: DUF1016 N-terminal domain-containing protein [Firmicutes bacterium]|nr:DUF1016 N-terminal domain-containing protein [Bacillota bacterium]